MGTTTKKNVRKKPNEAFLRKYGYSIRRSSSDPNVGVVYDRNGNRVSRTDYERAVSAWNRSQQNVRQENQRRATQTEPYQEQTDRYNTAARQRRSQSKLTPRETKRLQDQTQLVMSGGFLSPTHILGAAGRKIADPSRDFSELLFTGYDNQGPNTGIVTADWAARNPNGAVLANFAGDVIAGGLRPKSRLNLTEIEPRTLSHEWGPRASLVEKAHFSPEWGSDLPLLYEHPSVNNVTTSYGLGFVAPWAIMPRYYNQNGDINGGTLPTVNVTGPSPSVPGQPINTGGGSNRKVGRAKTGRTPAYTPVESKTNLGSAVMDAMLSENRIPDYSPPAIEASHGRDWNAVTDTDGNAILGNSIVGNEYNAYKYDHPDAVSTMAPTSYAYPVNPGYSINPYQNEDGTSLDSQAIMRGVQLGYGGYICPQFPDMILW